MIGAPGLTASAFLVSNADGVIFGNGGGGGGGGGVGRDISVLSSGGVNGFGAVLAPPVCFRTSRSDFMVRSVISGGGGGGGAGRAGIGPPAGGGKLPGF